MRFDLDLSILDQLLRILAQRWQQIFAQRILRVARHEKLACLVMAKANQVSCCVNMMQKIWISGCYCPTNYLELKSNSGETLRQSIVDVTGEPLAFLECRFRFPTFELNIEEEHKKGSQKNSKNANHVEKACLRPPSSWRNERDVVKGSKQQDRM